MDFSQPNAPAVGAVISGRSPATSLSFHESGQRCFVATSDSKLHIVDCFQHGKEEAPALRCERDPIQLIEATHDEHSILFTGKGTSLGQQPPGQRHPIQYWSVHDNKILRKFRAHTDTVTGISMSRVDDTFLTASMDQTVRLWNVRDAGCVGQLDVPNSNNNNSRASPPLACMDATGLVFAVAAPMEQQQGQHLHLYDARNYSAGAFAELSLTQSILQQAVLSHVSIDSSTASGWSQSPWTSLEFNTSGNQILVGNQAGLVLLLDGFEGTVQRVLNSPKRRDHHPTVCTYSSDDKTVLQGHPDGTIDCWNVDTGTIVKSLSGHVGPVQCIASNPKYQQIVSCCSQTALWCWP